MELDTGILEKKQSTTTTMADLYGYSVFSQDFGQRMEVEKERETKERAYYLDCVLGNEPEDEAERVFKQVFSVESAVVIKEDFTAADAKAANGMEMIGFTLLGALLTGGVWMLIEKIRKGKKQS